MPATEKAFLGIEIGGTKLQLGVGRGDGKIVRLDQFVVEPHQKADGILRDILRGAIQLREQYDVRRVGIGFGGPVDVKSGRVIKSHQIDGWDDFPLIVWISDKLGVPACMDNDCNVAALAEASHGAGRGYQSVFYVTVGTGVGGGLVVDGKIFGASRVAIGEIGHLRPGLDCHDPNHTVESYASGWGIVSRAKARLDELSDTEPTRADLMHRCQNDLRQLTAVEIAQAAEVGNQLASQVIGQAVETLGWAIAQVITLVAPQVVVVGGGVTSMDDALFLKPLKNSSRRYVFPPLVDCCEIVPAKLESAVVVHGALALAAREKT